MYDGFVYICGAENDLRIGECVFDALGKAIAVVARHIEIGDDEIERPCRFPDGLECFVGVVGGEYIVALIAQDGGAGFGELLFIVNHKNVGGVLGHV